MRSFADFSFEDLNPSRLAVVALAVVLTLTLLVYTAGVTVLAPNRYELATQVPDAGALEVGDPVRVAGVEVGEVLAVEPDFEQGHVDLRWEVDADVDLGPDTTVTIAIDGLLGGYNLTLEGPVEEPYLAELPADERHIPTERTRLASAVVQAIDDTSMHIQELDADLMERLMASLGKMADETDEQIDPLFDSVEVLAGLLAERDEELEALLEDSARVTEVLAERDEELVTLIEAADVVLGMLDQRREELSALLGESHEAVATLADFVADHSARIQELVDDSGAVLAVTERRLSDVNRLLAQVGPTLRQLSAAGTHGPWIDLLLTSLGPMPIEAITEEFGADVVYVAGELYESLQMARPVVAQEEQIEILLRTVGTLSRSNALWLTWTILERPEDVADGPGRVLTGERRQLAVDLAYAIQPVKQLFDEPDGPLRRLAPDRVLEFDIDEDPPEVLEEDELVRVLTDLFATREEFTNFRGEHIGWGDFYFVEHVFPIIHPLAESINDVLEDPDRLLEIAGEILQDSDAALDLLATEFEEQMVMLEPIIEAVRRAMR